MLRDARFIARHDLAVMLRQRETLLWVFVMPALFFYFIGTVTGGFGDPAGSAVRPDALALRAPDDAGFLLDALVTRLEHQNFRIVRAPDDAGWDASARQLTVTLTREDDDDRSVSSGRSGPLDQWIAQGHQVTVRFDHRAEGPGAAFDQLRVARAVYAVLADLVVLSLDDQPLSAAALHELAARPRALQLDVRPAGRRVEPPAGFAQAIPGTMVMFTMLVLLTSGAIQLVIERRQGLLRRLATTPISRGSLVLGKLTARVGLGLVQIGFAMLVGTLLFAMDWGPSIGMVLVLLFGWAAFNGALAIVLASVARTEGQMAGIGVVSTMVLAALGGAWWPIEITPPWMQQLALALPTGWAMDALHQLVSFAAPPIVALPHVAALLAGALGLGWLGARIFRYQ